MIGVIADVRESGVEDNAGAQVYLPATERFGPEGAYLVLRSKLPPAALAQSVMMTLRQLDPGQPATEFKPIQRLVDHATSPRHLFLRLPDLDLAKSAVLNSLSSPDAQRGYRHAIEEFIEWYCSEPRHEGSDVCRALLARRPNNAASRKLCGFELLSRGKQNGQIPDLFVRGKLTYQANLNTENPVGTVQSVEHVLRSLDKLASEQQNRIERTEKELADYKEQSERTFEHQARLQELLSRQIELTRMLDLDKGDQQANAPEPETNDREPAAINQAAITLMRASGASIESVAISARKPPVTGMITGKAVAAVGSEVAIATAANSFTSLNQTLWPLKSRSAISSQLDCNAGLRYSKAEWDLNYKSPGTRACVL